MRYSEEVKDKARGMAEKGMTPTEIHNAMTDPKPSEQAIREWVVPGAREKAVEYKKRTRARNSERDSYRKWLLRSNGRKTSPPKKLHACECPVPLWTKEVHDDTKTCLYCGRGEEAPQVADPGTP